MCAAIDAIMDREGLNRLGLSIATGIPNPCIYRWYSGKETPKMKNICKLITFFPYVKNILFKRGI
jgi:predicted DNA-binding transcriptional regulator AlpA